MRKVDGSQAAERPAVRRASTSTLVIAAIGLVAAMGATGLTAVLTRGAAHHGRPSAATHCAAPATNPPLEPATRLGSWPYHLVEAGSFGSLAPGGLRSVVGLQACGREENTVRAVRLSLGPTGSEITATGALQRGALLSSSVATSGSEVWLGVARLDLTAESSSPPYELSVERLDPVTLATKASIDLGRGYLLELASLPSGGAVASTGRQLFRIEQQGAGIAVRRVASFSGVAQHIAVSRDGTLAAVGMIEPGKVGAAAAPEIVSVDLHSGSFQARVPLPAGSDPLSLAIVDHVLWTAIGNGFSTSVERASFPSLRPIGSPASRGTGIPTALETVTLDRAGHTIWFHGLTMLGCADATTGRVLASTSPTGTLPAGVSQILSAVPGMPGATLAVTEAGIGLLRTPPACRS